MPNFIAEYDISYTYCHNHHPRISTSAVYSFLGRRFRNRGWFRSQYSVWRRNHTSLAQARRELTEIRNRVEAHYAAGAVGIFLRFHFQRHNQHNVLR